MSICISFAIVSFICFQCLEFTYAWSTSKLLLQHHHQTRLSSPPHSNAPLYHSAADLSVHKPLQLHQRPVKSFSALKMSVNPPNKPNPSTSTITPSNNNNPNILQFGNQFDIRVRLPTRDPVLSEMFLKNPGVIITTTYDNKQATQLTPTLWRIRFADIVIPGIDTISPLIDIDFVYVPETKSIAMQSKQWSLTNTPPSTSPTTTPTDNNSNNNKQSLFSKLTNNNNNNAGSKSGLLGDSGFLSTFQLQLQGSLTLEYADRQIPSTSDSNNSNTAASHHTTPHANSLISAVGTVTFQVQAQKPSLFAKTPSFVVDGAINLVQGLISDFVKKKFAAKLLLAFQNFAAQQHQLYLQQQNKNNNSGQ